MPCYWMKLQKKIAESNRTVNHLHAEAPRAEATPVVPEAPEAPEASEAPVAVEPSAPPARGHGCAGIKDQITLDKQRPLVFEHFFRCQKLQQVSIFVPFCTISWPSTSQARHITNGSVFSPSITWGANKIWQDANIAYNEGRRTIFVYASSPHKFHLNQEASLNLPCILPA